MQIKARVDVEEKQVETNPHMHKDEIFDSTDVNKEIPQSPSVTVDPSDVITAACQVQIQWRSQDFGKGRAQIH